MKCRLPLVLALFAVSCSPTPTGPVNPKDPGQSQAAGAAGSDRPLPAWSARVAQATEISGRKIEKSTDGPWEVRRTSGGGSDRSDLAARGAVASFALSEGTAARDGAVPAPSAPASAPVAAASPAGAKPGAADDGLSAKGESAPEGGEIALGGAGGAARPVPSRSRRLSGVAAGVDPTAAPAGEARPEAQEVQSPLRAGSTDDNAEFDKFLQFLATWSDRKDVAAQIDFLDVSGRRFIRVVNREGKPVPAARVQVVDEAADRVVLSARTLGDGRAPFYPRVPLSRPAGGAAPASTVPASAVADGAKPAGAPGSSYLVEASFGEARKRVTWDGKGEELSIEIDAPRPVKEPIALDVLFLIDTTGSMGDEIDRIKSTLLAVTRRLRSIEREFDLRYGAVLYKDLGDEYVTKVHPFTADIEAFDRALKPVGAGGGGDEPESLNQGLAEAVRMDFRERAAKVMFLIADAPPHMDYAGDVRYGESLKAAVDQGIRIHSVAASGLNPTGTFIFRQIAQYTRGKFIFIEYGSTAESAAAHGVTGKVSSNNLDDIIFEQIREEVATWGR